MLGNSYFDKSEILSIPKANLVEIEEQLKAESNPLDKKTVLRLIKRLKQKKVKDYLNQYQDYLHYLAGRVMKNVPAFIVEGDDVEIDGDRYSDFFKSLVHLFRNIMDHGIETDEERVEFGKSERGLIECRIAKMDDDRFMISISDDGRGIDLEKLRAKAISNHLYTAEELERMADSEIVNLVFSDHLSTKDSADSLSGRGMGMSAIREACRSLGGEIKITTAQGQGSTFVITLPSSIEIKE